MGIIKYLNLDYIEKTVIPLIHKNYVRKDNPAHNYLGEPIGMKEVEGCLERVQWDYVVEVIPKATQLFLCINLGHYFSNGNKRLALVTLSSFFVENGYAFRDNYNKSDFSKYLEKLFPKFNNYEDEEDFTSAEFAYYNLTIIVADNKKYGYSHDELKAKVEEFLNYSVITPEEVQDYGDIYRKEN